MKPLHNFGSVFGLATLLTLGACAEMNSPSASPRPGYTGGVSSGYGVVQSIEVVAPGIAGSGIGVGTIAGAVVGGIVGNQVGRGQGNTAATVIGAAGGAYAGHELEKRNQPQSNAYKFSVRMQNGAYQTVTQTSGAEIRVGDRVFIENGVARRY